MQYLLVESGMGMDKNSIHERTRSIVMKWIFCWRGEVTGKPYLTGELYAKVVHRVRSRVVACVIIQKVGLVSLGYTIAFGSFQFPRLWCFRDMFDIIQCKGL